MRKKKIATVIIGLVIVIITSCIYLNDEQIEGALSNLKGSRTGKVTIDVTDPINKFDVLPDITTAEEASMTAGGYFQNSNKLESLVKKNPNELKSFQTNLLDMTLSSVKVGSNRINLGYYTDQSISGPGNIRVSTYLDLVDATGNILKRVNVTNGSPTVDYITPSHVNKTYSEATVPNIVRLSANRFKVYYSGYRGGPLPSSSIGFSAVEFDSSLTNFSWSEVAVGTPNLDRPDRFIRDSNDEYHVDSSGNRYGYGWLNGQSSLITSTTPFTIVKINSLDQYAGVAYTLEQPEFPSYMPRKASWYQQLIETVIAPDGSVYATLLFGNITSGELPHREIIKWNSAGMIEKRIWVTGKSQSHSLLQAGMTDTNHIYFTEWVGDVPTDQAYKIYSIDISSPTNTVTEVMSFRSGTGIRIKKSGAEYSFFGAFNDGSKTGISIGRISSDWKIKSLSMLEIPTGTSATLHNIYDEGDEYYLVGETTAKTLSESLDAGGTFIPKLMGHFTYELHGAVKLITDYSPGIKFTKDSIKVNIEQSAKLIEQDLLKNIEVKDTMALNSNNLQGMKTQSWLDARINRNPKKLIYSNMVTGEIDESNSLPIDWIALGFDKTNIGPQYVKYFVTDDSFSHQNSSTSRWVNSIDKSTENDIGGNVFLRLENIKVSINNVSALTETSIRTEAKSKAWIGTPVNPSDPYVEDVVNGKLSTGKITMDTSQLTTIKAATTSEKAKPYPLDITYKDTIADGSLKETTRRIWVFVTNSATTVDPVNEVVIYGNDYRLPIHEAPSESKSNIYTKGNVVVYDALDIATLTSTKPLVLADATSAAALDVNSIDLGTINGATLTTTPVIVPTRVIYTKAGVETEHIVNIDLYHAIQTVTVKFIDEDNATVVPDVPLTGLTVGSTVDLEAQASVTTAITAAKALGYDLKEAPSDKNSVTVSASGEIRTFKFKGLIKFKSISPSVTFEEGFILPFQQELEYKNTNDFEVTIRDNRQHSGTLDNSLTGFRGDFTLTAQLTTPLTHVVNNRQLTGASIFYNGNDISGSSAELIKKSNQDPTNVTKTDFSWILDDKNGTSTGFKLLVPAGSAESGAYKGEITWTIVEGP